MADKDDDFDEWLDDVDLAEGDLDQDNIDELLSATEAPATGATPKGSTELDQDNIDALLGLKGPAAQAPEPPAGVGMDELDQDNIDALLSGTGYDADAAEDFSLDELDQENIDALLAGTDDAGLGSDEQAELAQDKIDALLTGSGPAAGPEESQAELDQNDIDALMGKPPAKEAPVEAEPPADFEQDNIDALFTDQNENPTPAPAETADDDLDALFGETEKESAPPPAAVEIPAELTPEESDELAVSAFDSELDEMDQLFADINNDIEEDDPFQSEEIDFAEMLGKTSEEDQEFIELEPGSQGTEPPQDSFMARAGAEEDDDVEAIESDEKPTEKKVVFIPALLSNMDRSLVAGIGGGFALLLLLGLYLLFSGPGESMDAHYNEDDAPVQQAQTQQPAQNFVPQTEDALFDMGPEAGELAITLAALDKDDQPLIYDITKPPAHGRLSGTAPHLTYLPDNTFPGEDHFEFTVSDGTASSDLALVTITGPDLVTLAAETAAQAAAEATAEKIITPQKPAVLAKDVSYAIISTEAVTLDWGRLWNEANAAPFAANEVHVEIVATAIKGSLEQQGRHRHTYRPDPFTATTDTIRYRFKKGGFRSETKTVAITVKVGSPAPELNIAELADGYLVGQKIIIDASASRDEARDSLQFLWEQTDGVPIDLHLLNDEGSQVTFTMPSSFYAEANPGPSLAVTAIDNTGKETRKEIKLKMISRRQTALWRGENGTLAADPPMQGRYFPWPFSD
jgi:hypothetical protein